MDVIRARTEGNPFFVSELVRLLSSQGRLDAGDGESVRREIPAGVRDTIRLRLSRLPDEALTVLDVAAVIGRDFDVDTLAAAAGVDETFGSLDPETMQRALGVALERAETLVVIRQ